MLYYAPERVRSSGTLVGEPLKLVRGHFGVTILVTIALNCAIGVGQERNKNSVANASLLLLQRPKSIKSADATYREYFAGRDGYIEAEFQRRYQLPANRTGMGTRHEQAAAPNTSATDPNALAQRREFAQMVMRVRLEAALNHYMATRDKSSKLRKAHSAISSMKHNKLKVSRGKGAKATPWEVQYGYNFFTDYSRFELVKGNFRVGLHHAALLADLTGPTEHGPRLNASTKLGLNNAPTAWIGYTLGSTSFATGLSKKLSTGVLGQVYSYQPTARGGTESYGVQLNYTF